MRAFTTIAALSALAGAIASPHAARDHHALAKRMEANLEKRFSGGRMTWYGLDTGADACTGKNHKASDYVVALNMPLFGNSGNGHCGKKVKISYGGKTATATVVDACASCPGTRELDLTYGLFSHFASPDAGIFYADWEFVGEGDDDDDDDDEPKPTTHKTTATHKATFTPKATPTHKIITTHKTTTTHEPTSTKKSSSVQPSSTKISSSATPSSSDASSSKLSSSVVVSAPAVTSPAATSPAATSPAGTVAPVNAGIDPSATAGASSGSVGDIQGAVGSNGPLTGSAIRFTFNSAAFGLTALLIIVQAL